MVAADEEHMQGEDERPEDTPAESRSPGAGARGAVAALVALVVVLAIGFVAYNALAGESASRSAQDGAASSTTTQDGAASGASASSSEATGSPAASDSAPGSTAAAASSESPEQAAEPSSAPLLADYDATVYTEYGDARTLTQLADGKPLVLNFWATWCPYCVQEMGDFQKIVDDYDSRVSFAFVDVADGVRETVDEAASWLLNNEYTIPAYYDTKREAQYAFGASALPTTAVVNAAGEIVTIDAGRIDPDRMRSLLDTLV